MWVYLVTYKQSVCYLHFGLILVAPGYGHFIVSITRTLWNFGLVNVTGCWGIFYWSWQILQEKWWTEYIILAKIDNVTKGQILSLWDCNILPLLRIIWPKEHISFDSFWYCLKKQLNVLLCCSCKLVYIIINMEMQIFCPEV